MKPSDTTLVLESAARVEEIQQNAQAKIIQEYEGLVQTFQELHGVNGPEAQYMIFQARMKLHQEEID